MASARSLLARVARLERATAQPQSPFVLLYGSVEEFAAGAEGLDRTDFAGVIAALKRCERDGVWQGWQRHRNGVWEADR